MTTLFVLLLAAALVAFVLTKKSQAPLKLVGNVKKIEETVAKVGEVATNALDVNGDGCYYITLGSFGIAGLEKFSPSTVKKVEAAHEE